MEKMKDLKDLLMHEIEDLYSVEEQIIEALPKMIEKADDRKLVSALKDHLKVTEQQKARLDEVKQILNPDQEGEGSQEEGSKKGFFGSFFGGQSSGKQVCKGMQGLIEEGQKVMGEDMGPNVMDAAIIACAQRIEHYEICGYGTARAYARELKLGDVAKRLEQTLNEEYKADDLLTALAVGRLNEEAEIGSIRGSGSRAKSNGKQSTGAKKSATSAKTASKSSSKSKSSLRTNKSSKSGTGRGKSTSASKGKSGGSRSSKSRGR